MNSALPLPSLAQGVDELPSLDASPAVQRHLGQVFALWDELSDHAVAQGEQANRLCQQRLARLIGAQHAFWVGTVRVLEQEPTGSSHAPADLLNGWRLRALVTLDEHRFDEKEKRKIANAPQSAIHPGAANIAQTRLAGQFRAHVLSAGTLVDLREFEQSEHYEFCYRQPGIRDRIWVIFPVNAVTESCFCFDRIGADAPLFSDDDLQLVAFALRGIRWFHRQLLLAHGIGLCDTLLSASERRVVALLLGGAPEQEIAAALELTRGTVHQYATRIYRKFGVRGRTEFTALWLAGAG